MGLRIQITALGGQRARQTLATGSVRRQAAGIVFQAAKTVETQAKIRSPWRTGRMRGSITTRQEGGGLVARVGTNVKAPPSAGGRARMYEGTGTGAGYPYPVLQEYVTTYRHPRGGEWGFLRKSLAAVAPEFRRQLQALVQRAAVRLVKGGS